MTNLNTQTSFVPGRLEQMSTRIAFFIAGLGIAAWAPLVPYAKARAGLDEGTLGFAAVVPGRRLDSGDADGRDSGHALRLPAGGDRRHVADLCGVAVAGDGVVDPGVDRHVVHVRRRASARWIRR